MSNRNHEVAAELLGALALAFGSDRAFAVRDVIDATTGNEILRRVLVRRCLFGHQQLGQFLARIEGSSFAGLELWKVYQSRAGHRYALCSAGAAR